MSDLRLECEAAWKTCTACGLHKQRTNVVLGYGDPRARLMFVGEGPGATEDETGKPFVGPAGDVLIDTLAAMKLTRTDVFIDNIVACRPTVKNGDEVKDRAPNKKEIAACIDRILEAIYIVDPVLIVALGTTAFHALTGSSLQISKARGGIYEARVPGWECDVIYPVLATYHPSFLNRNKAVKNKPDSVWGDMISDIELAVRMTDIAANRYHGVKIPKR